MKNLVLTILTLTLTTTLLTAQSIDIGVKAGVNYNFGGDLSELLSDAGNNIEDVITGADNRAGYHAGLFLKFNLMGMYVRPEFVYTSLNHNYNNGGNSINSINTKYKIEKIDVPILIGAKIIGPLHVYAGPSFQYMLSNDFSISEIDNVKTKDFSVGLQIGTGLELGRIGVDVRWEKGFSNKVDATFANTDIQLDNRPNQIIFGVSYRFNDRGRRR